MILLLLACGRPDPDPDPPAHVPEAIGRCAASDPLRQPFFGDTHVHTALSLDANLQGTRLRPADAYRFARGEAVGLPPYDADGVAQRQLQLTAPLDFAMVSDHAEFLGLVTTCTTPGADGYDDPTCITYRDDPDLSFLGLNAWLAREPGSTAYPPVCGADGCADAAALGWREVRDAAEAAYDRTSACTFTTFVGYEWSANPGTYNLHRNVVFRDEVVPDLPISYFDADTPEAMWAGLRAACLDAGTGCDALAIPHNPNLSGGRMLVGTDGRGRPLDATLAAEQAVMEPLIEVFQHKGASECWPGAPTSDEACGFEAIPFDSLAAANLGVTSPPPPTDFLREGLLAGLRLGRDLGANPYAFGVIGSTDTHVSAPGATADAGFPGHGGAGQGHRDALPVGLPDAVRFNPGGLAGVWAEENGRAAIFAALRRKETFGTSGSRLVVRVFGGWGLDGVTCDAPDAVAKGYAVGVPMGGTLPAPTAAAPTFWVVANQDPAGAPIARLQIVKGWLDGDTGRVAVYDVATAPTGTVDATCATHADGAASLCARWTDPDFDPATPAFWYVRVLEQPSCRWQARACRDAAVDCAAGAPEGYEGCCVDDVEEIVQERAWTSPIGYAP